MTTIMQKIGSELAFTAVFASVANYGLMRMLPASEVRFLVVASTASLSAYVTIRALSSECARQLTIAYGYVDKDNRTTNHIFFRLNRLFSINLSLLLLFIARNAGQRMGIQVPGYLQTIGYSSLVGCVVMISAEFLMIAAEAIRKPATN